MRRDILPSGSIAFNGRILANDGAGRGSVPYEETPPVITGGTVSDAVTHFEATITFSQNVTSAGVADGQGPSATGIEVFVNGVAPQQEFQSFAGFGTSAIIRLLNIAIIVTDVLRVKMRASATHIIYSTTHKVPVGNRNILVALTFV